MLVAERYRLGELLGRGGMGEVWRGQDEVLGRQVAVKLLLGDDGDDSAAQRFRLEAQTAARLNHPQVVSVYDFGSWDGRFYLVMELVNGPSLAQQLAARGPLSPAGVADVAAQAAAGLAAAHQQGVVHRDVKPGNLMLDRSGTVKIGDFGIARFVDETSAGLTRAGQIVGTSTYLAPERALGRVAGPASDVYALGCVLYHLLVGQPPFWAESPTALLYLHVDTPPTPPREHRPEVSQALDGYLLRMLAKEPEERPSAREVADWFASGAWRSDRQSPVQAQPPLSAGVPVGAASPPPPVPSSPPYAPSPYVPPAGAPVGPPAGPPPGMPGTGHDPMLHQESVTTYALPGSPATRSTPALTGHRRADAGRGRSGPGTRGGKGLRSPKAVAGAVAGVVAFAVAAVIGASLFASDGGDDNNGVRPGGGQTGEMSEGLPQDGGAADTTRHVTPAATPPLAPRGDGSDRKKGKKDHHGPTRHDRHGSGADEGDGGDGGDEGDDD
ncbi:MULTISPECIES: serine/threonine-protein kinase [Streptomyces]|nr:serine/threonine protein kinase [Streptomyces sp. TYQ1024]UBI37485.1 serine/threonine protein kinase [Streptomyces mobaraensis]